MNYTWHTRIAMFFVTSFAIYFYAFQRYPIEEIVCFCIMGYFHTVYASPDIDHPNSRPTKSMGFIGKITSKVFKHRGLLHNPLFWTIIYGAIGASVYTEYGYEAWWLTGSLVAIFTHIFLDKISTKSKRVSTKVRRKLHL